MGAAKQLDDPITRLLATAQAAATWSPEEEPPTEAPLAVTRGRARARTVSIKRLAKRDLRAGQAEYPPEESASYSRPRTRGDCLQGEHAERPCPFVSCKHHLYLDLNTKTGSVKLNFPDLEVWELPETCALDIADRGGITLEEVGQVAGITRERVRQIEDKILLKLRPEVWFLREEL